jgi:hypothetical protein
MSVSCRNRENICPARNITLTVLIQSYRSNRTIVIQAKRVIISGR